MKLSISVPDQLWERAKELRPELNGSHLVQTALERMVEASANAGLLTTRPERTEAAFERARTRIAAEARAQFEEGYAAGLEAAEQLPISCIESLATWRNFNVEAWAGGFALQQVRVDMGDAHPDEAPGKEIIETLGKGLGDIITPFFDDTFTPSVAYLRGYSQAMRDLWNDVYEGTTNPELVLEMDGAPMDD
jgi:post-segregation antitoxin (ccd killing protein)